MSLEEPPPWEVLVLVAHHLDPNTLAIASCVSKTWSTCLSSDHLWRPICQTHFPSLSTTTTLNHTSCPFRRLYAVVHSAATRRLKPPSKPRISLQNLTFVVSIHTTNLPKSPFVSVSKPAHQIPVDPNGVFKFEIKVDYERSVLSNALEDVKITWVVVLNEWEAVFTMMDIEGKVSFSPGAEGWFSEELPAPVCCSGGSTSGMVADLKLGFCGRRASVKVEKVSVGILSVVSWRYVRVDDGLRYLQHFLVPSGIYL